MFAIAIHGGLPPMKIEDLSPELERKYLHGLNDALNAAFKVLKREGTALDAVQAAVVSLENNGLFNAGKGSAFTYDGAHEMEAAIMCGKRMNAGAACGLGNVKNPVILARTILEKSNDLFYCGRGAEKFAVENGLQFEADEYFFSLESYALLQQAKSGKVRSFGTAGAVAIDTYGNLAAATSSGGVTNKNYGQVGASPVIGAGTFAKNSTCAVSCTGDSEYFIRSNAAYDISALLQYGRQSLKTACQKVVMNKLPRLGGEGGVIAIDKVGNIELIFNSKGMFRGYRKQGQEPVVHIF